MPTFSRATVGEIISERDGIQDVTVIVQREDRDAVTERAYVLTSLIGSVSPGDAVIVNTTGVELGLGTGGRHFVHWNLERDSFDRAGPDHIMKLRYTSLQFDAGTSELEHSDLAEELDGTPVLSCSLHSQVGVAAAVIGHEFPDLSVGYVMSDGAALPIAMSNLVATLISRKLLCGTVTTGHAFGGTLEAVSIPSALLLARHVLDCDVIIVGMGPGVVGTGTRYGTTAVEAAAHLDAAAKIGGRAVLAVRSSSGDERERHRGVSHHSQTIASLTSNEFLVASGSDLKLGSNAEERDVADLDVRAALAAYDLHITTMGRTIDSDEAFFSETARAAWLAASLVASS